jgi:hypothetical protein
MTGGRRRSGTEAAGAAQAWLASTAAEWPGGRPRKVRCATSAGGVAQLRWREKEIRVQRGNQVLDRCCVQRLGLLNPHGKGTARRHSVGTNTVGRTRSRDAWKRGAWKERRGEWVDGACVTAENGEGTSSSVCPTARSHGQGQATQSTVGRPRVGEKCQKRSGPEGIGSRWWRSLRRSRSRSGRRCVRVGWWWRCGVSRPIGVCHECPNQRLSKLPHELVLDRVLCDGG